MNAAICVLLFALGHLIRDGLPATGSTHLARALGAFFCMAGATAVLPPLHAVIAGVAIWGGFYLDQKHGEGQNARGWRDAAYLAWSGVTSLAPLAALAGLADLRLALLVLVGLAKPSIWFSAWWPWRRRAALPGRWLTPTRIAATAFGAAIGCALAAVAA